MKLTANRQLTGEYGTVEPGQEFEVNDEIGNDLVKRKLAQHPDQPHVGYETKVVKPGTAPEVSARQPFRDVPVSNDAQPTGVSTERGGVLSEANLSKDKSRTTDLDRQPGSSAGTEAGAVRSENSDR